MEKTELPADVKYLPVEQSCCSLLIVISGHCLISANEGPSTPCAAGHVYFVAAGTRLVVNSLEDGVQYYKTHVNMQE